MITLKNDYLTVDLHPKGAEIHRIVGTKDQLNYMWRRDPSQWANSAPILFPIVGAVRDDTYRVDGKTYHLTQHGFARHNEFEVTSQSDQEVVFTLKSNPEILKQYPYLFELKVTYRLNESTLECFIEVKNVDEKPIVFAVGGHPAFACPLYDNESSNDYYLEFEKNETLDQKVIDVAHRAMSHETKKLFDQERRFFVRQAMFDQDAVVVKDFKSEWVALRSLNHSKAVVFHMHHFNHLGIWAAKHVGGLIAIEPWVGHADYNDFTGELKDKEGVVTLPEHETFECDFAVEIVQ